MKFPQFHLATSVTNRILDLADEQLIRAEAKESAPSVPDVQQQSAALDQAIQTPPVAVPAPVGSEEAIAIDAMDGGSAADAVGNLAVLDTLGV